MTDLLPPRCDECLQSMARLAEMPAVVVFSCATCGATCAIAKPLSRSATDAPPAGDRGARGTARIVRFTIGYLAFITMLWALAIPHLSSVLRVALVLVAAAFAAGAVNVRAAGIGADAASQTD